MRSLQALSEAATDGRVGLASARQLPSSKSCTWRGERVGAACRLPVRLPLMVESLPVILFGARQLPRGMSFWGPPLPAGTQRTCN